MIVASLAVTAGCSSGDMIASDPETVDVAAPPSADPRASADASSPPPGPAAPPDPPNAARFEATVEVSRPSGDETRMVFRGVTLHRDNGLPVVVSYASNALWDALDKRHVRVLAVPYQPEGRSIAGEHMRVLELLTLASGEPSTVAGFSRPMKVRGSIKKATGEKGSKREGETWLQLVTDGRTYEVFGASRSDLPVDQAVEVQAREVTLSATSAHGGGPFVFIESVTKP